MGKKVELGLQFQRVRVPGTHGGDQSSKKAGRYGAEAVAESLHSDSES